MAVTEREYGEGVIVKIDATGKKVTASFNIDKTAYETDKSFMLATTRGNQIINKDGVRLSINCYRPKPKKKEAK